MSVLYVAIALSLLQAAVAIICLACVFACYGSYETLKDRLDGRRTK